MAGERVKLSVREREGRGTGDARRLRREGMIPGVLYGRGKSPHAICVEERELRRVLTGDHGLHAILDVTLDQQKTTHASILKDYQVHPVADTSRTSTCRRCGSTSRSRRRSSIELVGDPEGVKEGGVLSQVQREINVEALPLEIPSDLELDVSGMAIGDTLRLARPAARARA